MLHSKEVTFGTFKVKCNVTPEMVEDIKNMKGFNWDLASYLETLITNSANKSTKRKHKIRDIIENI